MTQPAPTEQQIISMVIQGLTTCMAGRALKLYKPGQGERGDQGLEAIEIELLREKILCLARALVIILEE